MPPNATARRKTLRAWDRPAVWDCMEDLWRGVVLLLYVCYINTYYHDTMKHPFKATDKWETQFQALWPALKGSLVKVYKPCFTHRGRRRCLYVPLALVPVIRQAHKNGRRLEDLLYRVGPALLKKFRRQRP